MKRVLLVLLAAAALAGCSKKQDADSGKPLELTFFYPVNIGGAVPGLINKMADDFHAANPDIIVKGVYTGNYYDNAVQVMAAFQAGNQPDFFMYDYTSCLSIISTGFVSPLDDLLAADSDGQAYINDFLEGFMIDAFVDGQLWSIPFQRSTMIMYYNKDAFREVGLDPEKPPSNWDERLEYARRLTSRDAGGNVTRWGIGIDGDNAQWWFGAVCVQNSLDGSNIMTQDGRQVFFNRPENIEALQYVVDLSEVHGVMPKGILRWSDLPTQFLDGQYAMIYHTSGNLTNISQNAPFEFGAAFLPGRRRPGACTGGGSFFISSGISEERRKAAWRFIRFVTEPERQAQWNVDTGYVAVRKSAKDTRVMQDYYNEMPQARVAMEQVPFAVPELMVRNNQVVWDALNTNLEAALIGDKTVKAALDDAQALAERALRDYQ